MVKINAKKANGEGIGSNSFPSTGLLSSVFAWLAGRTSAGVGDLSIRLPSGAVLAGDGAGSATVASLFPGTAEPAEVDITVDIKSSASGADPNELIRSLFRQGAPPAAPPRAMGRVGAVRGGGSGAKRSHPDFDPDARAHLPPEEQARLALIDENLATALEYAPEQFGQVQMLFVSCEINKVPITAFVDSGAQSSFISAATAARCDLQQLIDSRPPFVGIAQGVGEQKIVGSIHMVPVNVNGMFLPFSFRVLEQLSYDVIIGLDQLRRHQMIINLADGRLHIGEASLPFLSEWEVAHAAKEKEEAKAAQELVEKAEAGEGPTEVASATDPPVPPPPAPVAPAPAPAPAPPNPDPSSTPAAPPTPTRSNDAQIEEAAALAESHAAQQLSLAERRDRIQQLMDFTGLESVNEARQLLEVAEWDLEAAASLFFEAQ